MRKIGFAFLISLVMCQVLGQGNYYIYIQSADHKPFYVRSGSKIFYSSGNGYLVMENLANASYDLMIGFPDTPSSEWQFSCSVNDDDAAFILKNDNGKKVELSGLKNESKQSGKKIELKPEKAKTVAIKQATGIVSDDPFSSMLAEVVNDPTIRQQPVIIPRPGDSLKLAKTAVTDSARLVAANTVVPKTSVEEKPATDSQAIAKTFPALTDSQAHKEVKGAAAKGAGDSNTAIVKAPVMENRKPATEDKTTGKKNEDKSIASAPDNTPKDKVVADSAVSVTPKDIAFTAGQKHTGEKPVAKETVTEKTADPVTEKQHPSPGKTLHTASEKEKAPVDKIDKTKAEQKEPASAQMTAANNPASSSELINAAMEEADKKKQSGVNTGAGKIVLGTSVSIKKTLQRRSNEGMELIYTDQMDDGTQDTIRILIPSNK
jgi:hypothetical protein